MRSKLLAFGTFVIITVLSLAGTSLSAQMFCENELVYYNENFGVGTTAVSNNHVLTNGTLEFTPNGIMETDGTYRVINSTWQKPEWHNSADHTPGDVNGRMMVINGYDGNFYRVELTSNQSGFQPGDYGLSAFVMNVNTPGTCSPTTALLPSLTLTAEYLDESGNWVKFMGAPFTTGEVPQSAEPTWVQLGGILTLPALNNNYITHTVRITIGSATEGGCGNDFALDDIHFATCPSGGPLPVAFLGIDARQKGNGVNVEWSTSSEYNNKYFVVERSNDGGHTWFTATKVNSQGNSNTRHDYSSFDAKPQLGLNYYRVRQVDFDGTSKFSSTVVVKVNIDKTSGTVLTNPFRTDITLDFLSSRSQMLNARVFDNMGRMVINQQLSLNGGTSRKIIPASRLQTGMYIIQVIDDEGNVIVNSKLVKM